MTSVMRIWSFFFFRVSFYLDLKDKETDEDSVALLGSRKGVM